MVETPWRLKKAKTLVKVLALAPGHQVHRDVLIEQLWPDVDPAAGANNLHQALHAARRVVGAEQVVLRDEVIVLGADSGIVVDVDAFGAAAASALASNKPADLQQALDLWGGELLPEDLYEDWATSHRERLNATRAKLVTELTDALVADGRSDE